MSGEKPTPESLQRLIDDANAESALRAARTEMIELFEADDWEIAYSAENDARKILREWGKQATQWAIAEYCLQQLKIDFTIRAIGMGEPQGSRGLGYIMKNVDGKGLYIQMVIAEEGVRKVVKVLSFKY
jgi:hypothetical protein